MKRKIAVVLLLALLAGVFPASRAEETPGTGLRNGEAPVPVSGDVLRSGDFLYRVLEDGTAELADYLGEGDFREIPGEIAGRPLTSLGDRCFSNLGNMNYYTDDYPDYHREHIRSLRVPEGVVRIGDYAFEQCFNLTDIELPESLRQIGEGAFDGCTSLMKADLPQELRELGSFAFRDCTSLTAVRLPGGLTEVGTNPFAGCSHLFRLSVSPSHAFLRMEGGMLYDTAEQKLICCTAACGGSRAELPEGLRAIGGFALAGAPFEEILLPASLEEIGSCAFSGCADLREITIPEGVKTLGDNPFRGCLSLEAVGVSAGQERFAVEDGVLLDREEGRLIAWLRLPARLKKTGFSCAADENLPAETEAGGVRMRLVAAGWTNYADTAEEGPEIRYMVPDGIREIGGWAFSLSDAASVLLPDSVSVIGPGAFEGCEKLREINLPEEVRAIPDSLFRGCAALKAVTLPEGTESVGAFAFERSGIEEIRLPDTVRALGQYAFRGCEALRSVRLSESLTAIPKGAFLESGVERLVIPEQVKEIGAEAFACCYRLTAVSLPSGLTAIPEYCFYDSSIGELTVPSGVVYIGDHAFRTGEYNASRLTRITLPEHLLCLGSYAFGGGELEEITLPGSLVFVGCGAFCRCLPLREVRLEDGLTAIPDAMFRYCSLESIGIPDSVTSVGAGAFDDCLLRSVFLPDSVAYIGCGAFCGCDRLEAVRLPAGKTEFGGNPFGGCLALKYILLGTDHPNLTLSGGFLTDAAVRRIVAYLPRAGRTSCAVPEGIESIGAEAFAGADLTGGITLPDSLRAIEDGAFEYAGLTEIRLPASLETIGRTAFAGTGLTALQLPEGLRSIGDSAFENTQIREYRIPASVERIGDGAIGSAAERIVFGGGAVRVGAFTEYRRSLEIVLPDHHPTLEMAGGNLYSREDRRLIALLTDEPVLPGTRVIERNALNNRVPMLPDSVEEIRIYGTDWWGGWVTQAYVVPGSAAEAFFESHLSW